MSSKQVTAVSFRLASLIFCWSQGVSEVMHGSLSSEGEEASYTENILPHFRSTVSPLEAMHDSEAM